MDIAERRRAQLEAILKDLRHPRTPIDNPRIERALIAVIEAVLESVATGPDAESESRSTGFHGA